MSAAERLKVDALREDKDGYPLSTSNARPLGRLYSSARTSTVQYEVRCTNGDHSGCKRWISAKKVPDPKRLVLWLIEGYDLLDSKAHLATFDAVVKPL